MFGELSILLLLYCCFLPYFSSVHGCMGMDVWVNVFTMPFLCADSGPWRKMSRAWPAMSAITTSSGSTCPSHQESAWGALEAIQERFIMEDIRKGIVVGEMLHYVLNTSTNVFCQYCPRREVLRRGTGLTSICQASRLSPTVTSKRTRKQRYHVWWVELFVCATVSWCISCTLSQMFSVRTILGDKASEVEQVPSFLKVAHHHTGQEEEQ